MLFAVAKVVLEVIPMMFQYMIVFVLDFRACAPRSGARRHRAGVPVAGGRPGIAMP